MQAGQHEKKECAPRRGDDLRFGNAILLFQEKWVLFIVLSLMDGPMGFNQIARQARQVNPTTLSNRLRLLEKAGLVSRTVVDAQPPRSVYQVTEAGLAMAPVFASLREWSKRYGWTRSLE